MDTQSVTGETLSWNPIHRPAYGRLGLRIDEAGASGETHWRKRRGGPCGILPNRSECRTARKWETLEGTPPLLLVGRRDGSSWQRSRTPCTVSGPHHEEGVPHPFPSPLPDTAEARALTAPPDDARTEAGR